MPSRCASRRSGTGRQCLGSGQGIDGPHGDSHGPAFDARPVGVEPRIANDVERRACASAHSADERSTADKGRPAPWSRRRRAFPDSARRPTLTSIITGGKAPGIDAEASRMLLNSAIARGSLLAAIAVMFQITGSSESRLVVPTSRIRPFAYSAAISSSSSRLT